MEGTNYSSNTEIFSIFWSILLLVVSNHSSKNCMIFCSCIYRFRWIRSIFYYYSHFLYVSNLEIFLSTEALLPCILFVILIVKTAFLISENTSQSSLLSVTYKEWFTFCFSFSHPSSLVIWAAHRILSISNASPNTCHWNHISNASNRFIKTHSDSTPHTFIRASTTLDSL